MSIDIAGIVKQYLDDITNLPRDEGSLDETLERALVADHELRRLFASDPQNLCLHDLYLGLIDVFSIPASARLTQPRSTTPLSTDFSKCYIFPLSTNSRRMHLMPSTVPTLEDFLRNWDIFSHKVLSRMSHSSWQNIIVAGGSVLASLMSKYPPSTSTKDLNQFYLGDVWGTSDIDLFLWGLSPEQARQKIQEIYDLISESAPWHITCVRKTNVISIHVLAGFDVDAACCAFDGQMVWVNPRSLTAIIRQANTVDITRRSPSYEVRLAKYAERGFEIYLPSLSRMRINPMIYDRNLPRFPRGLACLLVLERLYTTYDAYLSLRYPKTRVQVEKKVASEDEDPLEAELHP